METNEITSFITRSVPDITEETMNKLKNKLSSIGLTKKHHMEHLERDDLSDILTPIQARILIKKCRELEEQYSNNSIQLENSSNTRFNIPSCSSTPQNWAEDFEIPWSELSKATSQELELHVKPSAGNMREIVKVLATRIYDITITPGRKNLRIICEKLISKYPEAFQDKCFDGIIADGTTTMVTKLEHAVENKKRVPKRTVISLGLNNSSPYPCKKRIKDSYGCANWQPSVLPLGETPESLENKRLQLKLEHGKFERNASLISEIMEETYIRQRHDINQRQKTIADLKMEWPFLFEEMPMLAHFDTLICKNTAENFQKNIGKKGGKIIDCPRVNKKNEEIHKICLKIEAMKQQRNSENMECIGIFEVLMKFFQEDSKVLFREYQDPVVISELTDIPSTPHLVVSGGTIYTSKEFILFIDSTVAAHSTNFMSSVTMLFASFYIFNIEYPETACITLEFLQRCFAEINPTRGSKAGTSKKKCHQVHPKILQLNNLITQSESLLNL